jgi:integrase
MDYQESRKEYCQYMSERIFNKLREAEEYELLAYALCGLYLRLRSSDILKLEWNQFDLENMIVKDVYLTKLSNQRGRETTIDTMPIHQRLKYGLGLWRERTNDKVKVFPNLKRLEISHKIGEIIGDIKFSVMDLRSYGLFILDPDEYSNLA